jgi:hypothetical protein
MKTEETIRPPMLGLEREDFNLEFGYIAYQ